MSLKTLIASTLLTSAAFATNFVDYGIGGGYRQDRMHWALYDNQGFNAWDMKYDKLQSAEIDGYFKGIYKYIYVHGHADFAWVLSGKNKTGFLFDPNLNVQQGQTPAFGVGGTFRFSVPMRGRLSDGEAVGGVAVSLWEDRLRHIFLIPFGGISSHKQLLRYRSPHPKSSLITDIPAGIPFTSASLTPKYSRFSSTWWGPMLGLNLDLRPVDSFELEVGYSRLFLKHKQKQNFSGIVMLNLMGMQIPETIEMKTRSKFKHLKGNQARGKIAYHVYPFWKLGLVGSFIHVTAPKKRKMELFQELTIPAFGVFQSFTNLLNTKASWTMYDILFESGFTF